MLERAIISEVSSAVEETVYRVEGVGATSLFSALADAGVNVGTILRTGRELLFSGATGDAAAISSTLDGLDATWTVDPGLAQVSVVGAGMKSHPSVAATALATLEEIGIEPVLVMTSPVRISCHVRQDAADRAVRALHDAFDLSQTETPAGD